MIGLIRRCIASGELVELIYLSGDGSITQRTVSIKRENSQGFLAFCHMRKSARIFNWSNILSAQVKRQHKEDKYA